MSDGEESFEDDDSRGDRYRRTARTVERTVTGEATSRFGALPGGTLLPSPHGESSPRLVVLTGEQQGRRVALEGPLSLGRAEDCELQLDDGKVSRKHARIDQLSDGTWTLEDLGSRNGTLVNGEPIVDIRPLRIGDRIQLSHETLLLFTRQDPLEDLLLHRQQMEVIGQLAAGIAHDFNNLLNVVLASAAHLTDLDPTTPLDHPEVRECHADIQAAASRAAELTARLLGLARRRKQKRGPKRGQVVDVSRLCDDVLQLVGRTFDRSVAVESDVEPNLTVAGDYAALHQVLMNLSINARDAMPEGGRLRVEARLIQSPPLASTKLPWPSGPHIALAVKDTGVGMDEETRHRVFEPFFSTKESGAGSGLGLATVYEVVTSHGGVVEVESEPGEGSTFVVRLPARIRTEGSSSRKRAVLSRRRNTLDGRKAGLGRRGLILVVDDQELVRRSLGRLVKSAGHDVLYAGDGQEALEQYLGVDRRPDVVLLDLDMPTLAGEETLLRLKEIDPGARVILVSGYHDDARRRRLLDAGAAEFLPKPVEAQRLRDAIHLALLSF